MKLIGYGVTKDGVPYGVWPVTLSFASGTFHKVAKQFPACKMEIHEVYQGTNVIAGAPWIPEGLRPA